MCRCLNIHPSVYYAWQKAFTTQPMPSPDTSRYLLENRSTRPADPESSLSRHKICPTNGEQLKLYGRNGGGSL